MEGWINVYIAGVFLGPQYSHFWRVRIPRDINMALYDLAFASEPEALFGNDPEDVVEDQWDALLVPRINGLFHLYLSSI